MLDRLNKQVMEKSGIGTMARESVVHHDELTNHGFSTSHGFGGTTRYLGFATEMIQGAKSDP